MNSIETFDRWIVEWISTLHTPVLNQIMKFITSLGNSGAIWIALSVVLLFYKRYRVYGILSLISLALCSFIGELWLKHLFERPRPFITIPELEPLVNPSSYSFPSGHSASSFASAGILMHINRRTAVITIFLATLIALSRLYVLVHYPSDIITGILLGLLCAAVVWNIYKKNQPHGNNDIPSC